MTCPSDQRERAIRRVIWTFQLSGILLTREEAGQALDEALHEPLPEW